MARYDRRQVQRIRFALESAFGADQTGDVANNFFDLRHFGTAIVPDTLVEKDMTVRQRFFQERGVVLGPKRGSIQIQNYLTSTNEALDTATTSPTKTSQSRFLEALMGGYVAGAGGSTVAASPSPTTTGATVQAGHGARFSEGQIALVEVAGVHYPVYITDVSTDALTWWPALPAAPSSGDDVLNAQCCYLDETDETWLQILSETQIDRGNIWLLRGCQGNLELSLERGLITWQSTLRGARRDHDDEIATPQGGSALAAATYDGTRPIFGSAGGFHFGPSASSTRNLVRVSEFKVNPGIAFSDVPDHAGLEGIGEMERDLPEITVEMTVLIDATAGAYEAYQDAFEAETEYGLLWWVGSSGGNVPAIAIPTMQIQAAPEPAEAVNGYEALKLSLLVKESNLTGAVANALQVSPIVIGCG